MTVEDVIYVVADYYKVKVAQLRGPLRHREIARPRMVAAYLCRRLTDASYPAIGRALGGRNHATIISAHKKITRLVTEDPRLNSITLELIAMLVRPREWNGAIPDPGL